jgi:hypothetical protein
VGDFCMLGDGQDYEAEGVSTSTSQLTLITSGVTGGTIGSWTQLVASTGFQAAGFFVNLFSGPTLINGTYASGVLDIGIGASGSEQVLVRGLAIPAYEYGYQFYHYHFPIAIPAGTRLSARHQSSIGNIGVFAGVMIYGQGHTPSAPFGGCSTYGAATPTDGHSAGTTITSSGTANTMGSWTALTGSTSNNAGAALLAFQFHNALPKSTATALVDLGVGGAGSEQIVVPKIPLWLKDPMVMPAVYGPFPLQVPAGTRIAARMQDSLGGQTVDTMVYLLEP